MCLCLRHLAAPLAEESAEEMQATLVRESGIGVTGDGSFNPTYTMRESLFVEMGRDAGEAKLGPFPLRISHQRIEMAMARVPPAMIRFR